MDGDLVEIPQDPESPYPLGRRGVWHDPRNRMHAALDAVALLPRSRTWPTLDVYNQDRSYCVAEADVGVARTTPHKRTFAKWSMYDTEEKRFQLYRRAQRVDPWEGEEPEYEGTSTDAAFKVMRAEGAIRAWKWLFGVEECKEWAMHFGPFAAGTIWHYSMFQVNGKGYLVVNPDSGDAGGHAWRVVGFSVPRNAFRMINSWGRGWGQLGRTWVSYEDMEYLLDAQGEAATVII